ncbi:enoyl-CoA hydratase/carnithine racemase [Actinopolyspora biskrensis]|uniref:Enoyl-CoA hydratase/carnithine racemase n=1 Tax=Actinopolyspora biskrensis TaxID=1470178 RepID=A0A852YXM0_9ACTN|nr:enoyl-CoA hydratase-related protein [Actinopolyspora biskrensis]NYH78299.1 enoyl-CoA hydratase/carnithine racemase [Actinopolyspora biskrensis]
MSDADEILAEHHDTVLLLTLNRPARLNAWTPTMRHRYCELLENADRDPAVRVVVLTGAGNGFCAGSDITALQPDGLLPGQDARHRLALSMRLRKPVISAINGTASGAGLAAALFTDIRFTTPGASLTTAFSRAELVAEHGIAWLLPRLVGLGRAMDLLLAARKMTGMQAHALGLVDRVFSGEEMLARTMDYARTLARERSPAAMATIKQQVYSGLEAGTEIVASEAHNRMMAALRGSGRTEPARGARHRGEPYFPPLD